MSSITYGVPYVAPSAASADSLVLRANPGSIMDVTINGGAVPVWILLIDAVAKPVDGAVVAVSAVQLAANATMVMSWDPPLKMATGAVLVASTTGPTTLTASATCWFTGRTV